MFKSASSFSKANMGMYRKLMLFPLRDSESGGSGPLVVLAFSESDSSDGTADTGWLEGLLSPKAEAVLDGIPSAE